MKHRIINFIIGATILSGIVLFAFKNKTKSDYNPYDDSKAEAMRDHRLYEEEAEAKFNNSLYAKWKKAERDTMPVSDSEIAIFKVSIDTLIKIKK